MKAWFSLGGMDGLGVSDGEERGEDDDESVEKKVLLRKRGLL